MSVTAEDLNRVTHARIDRLEETVKENQTKIATVAEDIAFIRGYLQENGNGPKRRPVRDSAMVVGGGGIVGTLMILIEKFFGG